MNINYLKATVTILAVLLMSRSYAFDGLSPSDVVRNYCELDGNGARLSSVDYYEVRRLMAWDDDRDEPGWDSFKVISGYEILGEKIEGDSATVKVKYNIVAGGDFLGLDVNKTSETVDIFLKKKAGGWRVETYVPLPRIYIDTAIAQYRKLAGNPKIPADCIIEKLEKLKSEE